MKRIVKSHYRKGRKVRAHYRKHKMALRDWELIDKSGPKRMSKIWGLKNQSDVLWIDNWQKGNWAVVKGRETAPMTYEEDKIIINTGSKKDAERLAKEFREAH